MLKIGYTHPRVVDRRRSSSFTGSHSRTPTISDSDYQDQINPHFFSQQTKVPDLPAVNRIGTFPWETWRLRGKTVRRAGRGVPWQRFARGRRPSGAAHTP